MSDTSEMIADPRHISRGREIPTESYSDQPYIVKTDDGSWLCTMTTGSGQEGQHGQHVVCARSPDRGLSWTDVVDIEPADGPEASYAVLLKVPTGRVYCLYNHNTDNTRAVKADDPPFAGGMCGRVDSQGHYVFKYSDDHGVTWSAERYEIPIREMQIDRENPYGGTIQYFWNVGRPFTWNGAAYCSVHKVGGLGHGFFTRSEGVLLRSENIMHESDPTKIAWETLPEGDKGLRTPPGGGPISEEHSYTVLSDGTFFSVYRSVDGYPVYARSFDEGRSWTEPKYMSFAEGRSIKNPRAANFVWRCENGNFLYWFHNHGGAAFRRRGEGANRSYTYEHRNPVWMCGGVECDGEGGRDIAWSEPEIVLYDDDPQIRMSYPDLIEDGDYFVSETQKDIARVHELDSALLEAMWSQHERSIVTKDGCVLERTGDVPAEVDMPELPAFLARDAKRFDHGSRDLRSGFTIEMVFELERAALGITLLDGRSSDGRGIVLRTDNDGGVELVMSDGQTQAVWNSDPEAIRPGVRHHLVCIVDGGPKIVMFVLNGRLLDGGDARQWGWGRFSPGLINVAGSDVLRITPDAGVSVELVRIYRRALLVTEAVGNCRAET